MFSQTQADTSYTVYSTYAKEIKKYPFIKIATVKENKNVSHQNNVVYKSIDQRELHFDAYFYNNGQAHPAVILIHGGGWKSGNKSQTQLLAQQIAASGYSCFCIEYRLSPEAKYPAGVYDVKEAIKYIKNHAAEYKANPDKVAILGCSSGGQMAALIGTTNNNPDFEDKSLLPQNATVQAIIDMDGILAFHHPESEEGTVAALWLGGTFDEIPEVWSQASALTHCDENTPPILFINSNKPRFHAGRDDMIAILNKNSIYNNTKTLDNSPHSFWFFDPWFDKIVTYSTQFLDKIFKQL